MSQEPADVWELPWGDQLLPAKYATEHFMVLGATGTGKTVLITVLMGDVLPMLRQNASRAIIYDAKQDVVPVLERFGLGGRYKILHPFDARCHAWDMAADITDPISARQVSTILVPEDDRHTEGAAFFTHAVRDLLSGVFLTFIRCANQGSWTFRDVMLAMLYPQYLTWLLSRDVDRSGQPFHLPARLRQSYLHASGGAYGADVRTASNIRSTINAKLSVYEPIASVWFGAQHGRGCDRATQEQGRSFCLKEWLRSDGILVLGNDEASRTALDAINRALFKRMTELILAGPEAPRHDREAGRGLTWIFFDEVREAGQLDGLSRLLTKGRSKGAAVVLGLQDIEGLRAVYGEEVANELVGQCHNVVVLKLNSPSTAQWAADLFGRRIQTIELDSSSIGMSGITSGTHVEQQERAHLYTASLLYLPRASQKRGIEGYQRWSEQSDTDDPRMRLDWSSIRSYVDDDDRNARAPSYEALVNPDGDAQALYLEPWGAPDWDRLGFWGYGPIPSISGKRNAANAVEASRARPPSSDPGSLRTMTGM